MLCLFNCYRNKEDYQYNSNCNWGNGVLLICLPGNMWESGSNNSQFTGKTLERGLCLCFSSWNVFADCVLENSGAFSLKHVSAYKRQRDRRKTEHQTKPTNAFS